MNIARKILQNNLKFTPHITDWVGISREGLTVYTDEKHDMAVFWAYSYNDIGLYGGLVATPKGYI